MYILNRLLLVLTVLCFTMTSCVETPFIEEIGASNDTTTKETEPITRSTTNRTYESLPNPYALRVMQEVYDTYSESSITLEATDLYVKFMPKDSVELHTLKHNYNLELFDYPLDIELAEDEVYENPFIPDSDLTWVYTTVKPDFEFPSHISYEILEECYIPADGEAIGFTTRADEVDVEDAAFALMGYDEPGFVDTRVRAIPQGKIQVFNDTTQSYVPVKGVKVRCHRLVKWDTAYTAEDGSYTMSKSFRYNPHYAIVFDNVMDFDIWGNWGPIARANHNLGWKSNFGHSVNIKSDSNAWEWAVVNNAAYEYYEMCEQTGIIKPPAALKIWVWKNFAGSAAPMLRRITNAIGYNGYSFIVNFFINMFYGMTATRLNQMLKVVLPDITIGTINDDGLRADYARIYQSVNHELSHASHFCQVGSPYWAKYISYIMTYGAYGGNDSGNNAQLCAIGEMWGYFMGYTQAYERFGETQSDIKELEVVDTWIYPQVFWEIYTNNILTKKQIFDCLSTDVETYNTLVAKLYTLYPDKAVDIAEEFNNYPEIKHTVNLPGGYDVSCSNQSITSSKTIDGNKILVQNSSVNNNATLTLNAETSITIRESFVVDSSAKLILST